MVSGRVGKSLILFLVLALAMPGVHAAVNGSETNTFESLNVVVIEGEQVMSDVDVVTLRHGIDAYGDNNSHVSSLEVTNFEIMYEDFVKEYGNEYTLNGIEGQFTSLVTTFKNVEGDVNSTAQITYEYQGRITFAGIDHSLPGYTFRIVNEGGDLNSLMMIRITVPGGYEITDTQGILVPEFSPKKGTVSGQTLTDSNIVIDFAPADEWAWIYWPLLISGLISAMIVAVLALNHFRGGGKEEQFEPEVKQEE